MSVQTALVVMLACTVVAQVLSLALAGSATNAIRAALRQKNPGQIAAVGCLTALAGLVVSAGWVYVGLALDRPLIVAIASVNIVMSFVWQAIRAAVKS